MLPSKNFLTFVGLSGMSLRLSTVTKHSLPIKSAYTQAPPPYISNKSIFFNRTTSSFDKSELLCFASTVLLEGIGMYRCFFNGIFLCLSGFYKLLHIKA